MTSTTRRRPRPIDHALAVAEFIVGVGRIPDGEDDALAPTLRNLRRADAAGTLDPAPTAALDAADSAWRTHGQRSTPVQNAEDVAAHIDRHGDVPRKPAGHARYRRFATLRTAHRAGTLDPEAAAILADVDPNWHTRP